jgi:hypothetical protein
MGYFYYVDCCGVPRTGASLGQTICIDEALSGTSYGIIIDSGHNHVPKTAYKEV